MYAGFSTVRLKSLGYLSHFGFIIMLLREEAILLECRIESIGLHSVVLFDCLIG